MSWSQFANLIREDNRDISAWKAAIEGNPNTPEGALEIAINHFIQNGDVAAIDDLCSFVVSLVNQAVEHSVHADEGDSSDEEEFTNPYLLSGVVIEKREVIGFAGLAVLEDVVKDYENRLTQSALDGCSYSPDKVHHFDGDTVQICSYCTSRRQ